MLQQNGPWLYGLLANHIWSLGDVPDDRRRVSTTFLQPFITYTFPTQTTPFVSSESLYDWTREQWTVPINAGVNQLIVVGKQPMQVGGLVRHYAEAPDGGPDWAFQLRATFVFPQ